MSRHNLLQYKVSNFEVVGGELLVMCPLDALLVNLVLEDGYQALLINDI